MAISEHSYMCYYCLIYTISNTQMEFQNIFFQSTVLLGRRGKIFAPCPASYAPDDKNIAFSISYSQDFIIIIVDTLVVISNKPDIVEIILVVLLSVYRAIKKILHLHITTKILLPVYDYPKTHFHYHCLT